MASSRRAVLFLAVLIAAVFGPLVAAPEASTAAKAAIAVVHGDGHVVPDCVAIPSGGAKALAVLDKSSFDLYTQRQFGVRLVCYLDREGAALPPDCFGALTDPSWAMWVQKPGKAAKYSNLTVDAKTINAHDVLYMQFATYHDDGTGNFVQDPPPRQKFSELCGP